MRKRQRGDFAQRQNFRPAEFVGAPGRGSHRRWRASVASATSPTNTGCSLRRAAAEQRQRRQDARERAEAVEEIVFGAER